MLDPSERADRLVEGLGVPPGAAVVRVEGPGAGLFLRRVVEGGALFGAAPTDDPYGALRAPLAAAVALAPNVSDIARQVAGRIVPAACAGKAADPAAEIERIVKAHLTLDSNRRVVAPPADVVYMAWRLFEVLEAASEGSPRLVFAVDGRTGLDRFTAATLEAWATRRTGTRVVAVVAASRRALPSPPMARLEEVHDDGTARLRLAQDETAILAALIAFGRPATLDELCGVLEAVPDQALEWLDALGDARVVEHWGRTWRAVFGSDSSITREELVAANSRIAKWLERQPAAFEDAVAIERHGRAAGETSGPAALRRAQAAAARYLELGGHEECARFLDAAIAAAPIESPPESLVQRHVAFAFGCAFAGRFGASLDSIARAQVLVQDPVGKAQLDYLAAMILARRRQDDDAESPAAYARKALDLAKDRLKENADPAARIERCWIENAIAMLELRSGRPEGADVHIADAAAETKGLEDDPRAVRAIAATLRSRALVAIARRDAESARATAAEYAAWVRSRDAADDDPDIPSIEAQAAIVAGDAWAGASFRAAAAMAARYGDARLAATMAKNAGRVELERGSVEEALEAYRFALEMRRATGDDESIAAALMNVGLAARAAGDHDGAAASFSEAITRFRNAGKDVMPGEGLGALEELRP